MAPAESVDKIWSPEIRQLRAQFTRPTVQFGVRIIDTDFERVNRSIDPCARRKESSECFQFVLLLPATCRY